MRHLSRATRLWLVILVGLPLINLNAQPAGWKAYYGNLHSHTAVSDGVERPAAAFRYARETARVDFLCLSEHNHNIQINTTQAGLTEASNAATAATSATFVGLIGQEFSTIKNGNHVNLYDVPTQIPFELLNDYKGLFETWLPRFQQDNPGRVVVAQFNHPESDKLDYGRTRYTVKRNGKDVLVRNYDGDTDAFVRGADQWVRTIAILSGPADVSQKKETDLPFNEHRNIESKRVAIWKRYLDLGLHLSPAADQDNHSQSWGNRTAARTGVWINGPLTRQSLLGAIRANRTFATEDHNLSVWFSVNGQPMGSRLTPQQSGGELTIEVIARDADEATASMPSNSTATSAAMARWPKRSRRAA